MKDMAGAGWVTFGPTGKGTKQFDNPSTVYVDAGGRIYIADRGNNRIVRIEDMKGAGWTAVGSAGSGARQFNTPRGVFVDAGGKIYVADTGNNRIVRMDDMSGAGWTAIGTHGDGGVNQFALPFGVIVDAKGRIYVADSGTGLQFRSVVRMDDMTGAGWTRLGTWGTGAKQFNIPAGVFVDGVGRIY